MNDPYLFPLTSANLLDTQVSKSVMNFVLGLVIVLNGKVQPTIMIQDWQSGKWDVGWNPGHALPCFIVDLSGDQDFTSVPNLELHLNSWKGFWWIKMAEAEFGYLNWRDLFIDKTAIQS